MAAVWNSSLFLIYTKYPLPKCPLSCSSQLAQFPADHHVISNHGGGASRAVDGDQTSSRRQASLGIKVFPLVMRASVNLLLLVRPPTTSTHLYLPHLTHLQSTPPLLNLSIPCQFLPHLFPSPLSLPVISHLILNQYEESSCKILCVHFLPQMLAC